MEENKKNPKKTTKAMGRPKKYDIDTEELGKLVEFGCTNTEIASFFGCSPDLIEKTYSEFLTKGRATLKKRLRKAQLDLALAGNATMLIWLGKQMLGQAEKAEVQMNRPIEEVE